jgi:hypothetical protein
MPATDNELRALQQAARRYALAVAPDSRPDVVQVRDVNKRMIVALTLPVRDGGELELAASIGPRAGWDFAGAVPKFDGESVPITGRKLDLLKALAAVEGPVSAEQLREAWGGYAIEETTVRWTIGALRKALKESFPDFDGDPIATEGAGYSLQIR